MYMRLFFLSFFVMLFISTIAQTGKTEDVVYLKNESVVRGKILQKTDAIVKIQVSDGSIFVLAITEVEKITTEKRFGSYQYKAKGFAHFTELGPLIAGKTTIEGVTTAAFSFQTINGYKFSKPAFLGLGIGADLYATQTIIPVFGSFRGDISIKGSVIPFYFADAGYGINITQNSNNGIDFKGGFTYALGLGAKIPFNKTAGFLISFGYRSQKTSFTQNNVNKEIQYNRLAVRAGFFL
jgi:hypothetical protein